MSLQNYLWLPFLWVGTQKTSNTYYANKHTHKHIPSTKTENTSKKHPRPHIYKCSLPPSKKRLEQLPRLSYHQGPERQLPSHCFGIHVHQSANKIQKNHENHAINNGVAIQHPCLSINWLFSTLKSLERVKGGFEWEKTCLILSSFTDLQSIYSTRLKTREEADNLQ